MSLSHFALPHLSLVAVIAVLVACNNAIVATPASASQPAEISIPADLDQARPFVQWLNQYGLTVLSVQHAMEGSLFQIANQAAWIKTDRGIVDVVFFSDPAQTEHLQVIALPAQDAGRYLYQIEAPPPIMSHTVTMDAANPVYFIVHRGMFMVTNDAALYKAIMKILAEH